MNYAYLNSLTSQNTSDPLECEIRHRLYNYYRYYTYKVFSSSWPLKSATTTWWLRWMARHATEQRLLLRHIFATTQAVQVSDDRDRIYDMLDMTIQNVAHRSCLSLTIRNLRPLCFETPALMSSTKGTVLSLSGYCITRTTTN